MHDLPVVSALESQLQHVEPLVGVADMWLLPFAHSVKQFEPEDAPSN